jgi:hypothetical protein
VTRALWRLKPLTCDHSPAVATPAPAWAIREHPRLFASAIVSHGEPVGAEGTDALRVTVVDPDPTGALGECRNWHVLAIPMYFSTGISMLLMLGTSPLGLCNSAPTDQPTQQSRCG